MIIKDEDAPLVVKEKKLKGFHLSFFTSEENNYGTGTYTVTHNGTAVIEVECESMLLMDIMPFNEINRINDPVLIETFFFEQTLWLSDIDAALIVDFLHVIGKFSLCDIYAEKVAQAWKEWDFKLRILRGADIIQQVLADNPPRSLVRIYNGLLRHHKEVGEMYQKAYESLRTTAEEGVEEDNDEDLF